MKAEISGRKRENMKKAKFYTAVVTIFKEDGTLDYEGNRAIYEKLIQGGLRWYCTDGEHRRILQP